MYTSCLGVESADKDFHHGFTSVYDVTLDSLQNLLVFQTGKMGLKNPYLARLF